MRLKLRRRAKQQRSEPGLDADIAELIEGRTALERISVLTDANQQRRSTAIERALVRARCDAFAELGGNGDGLEPLAGHRASSVPVDPEACLPTVDVGELTAPVVRSALASHGSLLVRRLISRERAERLVEEIDEAFEGRDAHSGGAGAAQTLPWFERFEPAPEYDFGKPQWNRLKRGSGEVWATDSPRVLFDLLEAFDEAGLPQVITDYLGERSALSMHKSVLRRVTPDTGTDWHQDGAFLGEGIRSLNVWLALTPCGRHAPGLDVVPRRLERIVETGTEGAIFPWAVAPEKVEEVLDGEPAARPLFQPGDALLFDHMNLHRTAAEPDMPGVRYATETWCFAPSAYPEKQAPLVL